MGASRVFQVKHATLLAAGVMSHMYIHTGGGWVETNVPLLALALVRVQEILLQTRGRIYVLLIHPIWVKVEKTPFFGFLGLKAYVFDPQKYPFSSTI